MLTKLKNKICDKKQKKYVFFVKQISKPDQTQLIEKLNE